MTGGAFVVPGDTRSTLLSRDPLVPGSEGIRPHNLHRRHLTDSQRAMVAGKMATRKSGYRTDIVHKSVAGNEDLRTEVFPPTRNEASTMLNVSGTALNSARVVLRDGTPAVQALVESGKAPVTTAARVATMLSPDEQNEYAERVNNGMDPVAAAPARHQDPGLGRIGTRVYATAPRLARDRGGRAKFAPPTRRRVQRIRLGVHISPLSRWSGRAAPQLNW